MTQTEGEVLTSKLLLPVVVIVSSVIMSSVIMSSASNDQTEDRNGCPGHSSPSCVTMVWAHAWANVSCSCTPPPTVPGPRNCTVNRGQEQSALTPPPKCSLGVGCPCMHEYTPKNVQNSVALWSLHGRELADDGEYNPATACIRAWQCRLFLRLCPVFHQMSHRFK